MHAGLQLRLRTTTCYHQEDDRQIAAYSPRGTRPLARVTLSDATLHEGRHNTNAATQRSSRPGKALHQARGASWGWNALCPELDSAYTGARYIDMHHTVHLRSLCFR